MMKTLLAAAFIVVTALALGGCRAPRPAAHLQPVAPSQRPCPAPTEMGAQHARAVIGVFASPSDVDYATAMHMPIGVARAAFVFETDAAVCTAVSDGIAGYLHRGPKAANTNYLVIRAGNRYLALDPTGRMSVVYSVGQAYDDVRISLK